MLRPVGRRAVGRAGAPGAPVPRGRARARWERRRACASSREKRRWRARGGRDRGAVGRARAARAPRPAALAAVHRPARRAQARRSRALPDGVRAARRLGRRADRGASLHAGASRAHRQPSAPRCTSSRCTWASGTFRPLRADRSRGAPHRRRGRRDPGGRPRRPSAERAREGRRVVAVGTTTTRALEWAADGGRPAVAPSAAPPISSSTPAIASGSSTPSSPTSTCRARPCSCSSPPSAGASLLLRAYRHAVAARYRFYSYGDAMLIA